MNERSGHPGRIAVGFARSLRSAGVSVPLENVLLFVEALGYLGLDKRSSVYWAGRTTLIRHPEDRLTYDRVFDAYWLGASPKTRFAVPRPTMLPLGESPDQEEDDAGAEERASLSGQYSFAELLSDHDFAQLTAAEWDEIKRLIDEFRLTTQWRRTRRLRPAGSPANRPDVRRTVRRALRSSGEPIRLAWRAQTTQPRRLIFLLDVSGSMNSYARALLRFSYSAVRSGTGRRAEVFTLGTRLTRITKELSGRDPDSALPTAAAAVRDWSGGTRLGEVLEEFNNHWGARGMARGSIVVILSDGWDRGDPDVLGTQMARLHRQARRVIWVNPLKASPEYAPLARGMAAALPWVDDFVAGNSLAALDELGTLISGQEHHRKLRRRKYP